MKTLPVKCLLVNMLVLSGCSWLVPYDEEFSCKLKDNYGKCVSVEQAYEEAVSGEDIYPDMGKGKDESAGKKAVKSPYTQYRSALYQELKELVDDPETPMLRPAKTIRTLIIPYSAKNQKKTLYGTRYVYSIIDDPVFVLGEYLYKKPSVVPPLMEHKE